MEHWENSSSSLQTNFLASEMLDCSETIQLRFRTNQILWQRFTIHPIADTLTSITDTDDGQTLLAQCRFHCLR